MFDASLYLVPELGEVVIAGVSQRLQLGAESAQHSLDVTQGLTLCLLTDGRRELQNNKCTIPPQ
jgi:hypothetical protein